MWGVEFKGDGLINLADEINLKATLYSHSCICIAGFFSQIYSEN